MDWTNTPTTKRKYRISPTEYASTSTAGMIDRKELMLLIQESMGIVMEEKLKNVSTKTDIEEMKEHILDINGKFELLKEESSSFTSGNKTTKRGKREAKTINN